MSSPNQDQILDMCNVFVKYLPSDLNDTGLYELFSPYGDIVSAKVMVDHQTGNSLGYGFVRFQYIDQAQEAIQQLSGKRVMNKILLCKLSNYSSNPSTANMHPSTNLYIKPLLSNTSEDELREMFSRFGAVLDCKVMVDKHTGVSRQIGFVRFDKQEEATRAMTTMNGKKLDPSAPPLVVRYAETEHQRSTRKTRSSSPVPREPFFLPQSAMYMSNPFEMYGMSPMGYGISPGTSPMGSPIPGSPLSSSPIPGSPTFSSPLSTGAIPIPGAIAGLSHHHHHNLMSSSPISSSPVALGLSAGNSPRISAPMPIPSGAAAGMLPAGAPLPIPPGSPLMGSPIMGSPLVGSPMALHGGYMISNAPLGPGSPISSGPLSLSPVGSPIHNFSSPMSIPGSPGRRFPQQSEGTNLFVFHLPSDIDDAGLYELFSPFGPLESVKVITDRGTLESKGYGFVKFCNPDDALYALTQMNGIPLGKKHLKVSFKTPTPVSSPRLQHNRASDSPPTSPVMAKHHSPLNSPRSSPSPNSSPSASQPSSPRTSGLSNQPGPNLNGTKET